MCDEFAKIMHAEFEMSMMGELNFFLGLQIKQMEDVIFFNQSKYIKEMLKKFGLEDAKPMKTPMSSDTQTPLKTKSVSRYIVPSSEASLGSLFYLTASRPDIMFSVCLCGHFQEAPKTSHLEAVKRIFRYIKGTTHLGLWYPKGTGIETVVYADSDHAGDYTRTSPKTLDRPKRALVGVKGIRVLALETSKNAQATEILKLKTRIKSWRRSKKESVSKQGRKNAKPGPTLDDSAFDNLDADGIDYMDTEKAVNKGRQSKETEELNVTHDTEVLEKGGSNEEQVNDADKEYARQVNAELQAELERERVAAKEATQAVLASEFDGIQARMNADTLLSERLQEAEREQLTVKQRAVAIRNKPLTKTQLRNQILRNKKFDEVQILYEKTKKSIQDFVPIRSSLKKKMIEKMNKKDSNEDVSKKEKVLEEPDSTKMEDKQEEVEESTRKRPSTILKMKARKKARKQTHVDSDASKKKTGSLRMKRMSNMKKTDFDLEEEEYLKTFLKIVLDEEGIVDYEVLEKRFLITNWESKFYHYDKQSYDANAEDELGQIKKDGILRVWNFMRIVGFDTFEHWIDLVAESGSDSAYDLLRFIQKQIDESGSYDGSEKDL
ncbi:retrovirus-related pol polyprotein from transposon TNT 1-94 [Tanacetum coccineum]|uniref:Retrovirus-related pol polyprotein from transposon TNT 1-94 n=1 Tax=Tanacetum coccineum TaxID=301880 RepID=A0ABQ5IGA1_9ASTR